MRKLILSVNALLLVAVVAFAAETPPWDKLIDVTIQHIKMNGPDSDVAQFISMAGHSAWARRDEFADLVIPHLKSKKADNVAGAIEVLYRLRHYHPMSYHGDFAADNAQFFKKLDEAVYPHFDYFHSLNNREIFHQLALYLGVSPSKEAKRELLRIAKDTPEKEQALICLAWHRDPKDMESLLPFMLEDSQASRALPYHFRNSYGQQSIPYLKKAISESKSASARLEAAFELVHLRIPEGFRYLVTTALQDPEPDAKHTRHLDRIKQFAIDYLELPRSTSSKEAIVAHIEKKQGELCKIQR